MATDAKVEPRSERKRREILEAARTRFMIDGYAGAGMELVARLAGVSTATLYCYFPSKADLFQHVVEDTAGTFSRLVAQSAAVEGDGSTRLRGFALAYASFVNDPFTRAMFRLVTAERQRFDLVARDFYRHLQEGFGGALIAILHRLQEEGALGFDKASWAAGQLMGMIEHATFLSPLLKGDDTLLHRSLEEVCDDAVATFLARYATP